LVRLHGAASFINLFVMEVKSSVEIRITKFLMSYGSETLIYWLDHFDRVITTKEYPLYKNLEREACRACEITLSDMHLVSNTPCTNAKRIVSFISFHQLHLPVPSISKLLNLSDRMINYYICDAENWINSPKTNKVFVEAYNKVIENLKLQ
jgi:hypothetical protein